ncbi:GPW/gp25 family protein [Herbaspirillum autotrophicum]|uniref:GPW/gp25 family protein n=1 Tax=Herbaspirillum autotrophicum TaxID=180195 RepID=UPI00067B08AC
MSAHSLYNKLSKRFHHDSLREIVAHHLVELMNCSLRGGRINASDSSPVAYSVLNYGCPPLQISGGIGLDPVHVAAHIGEVIRRFEPRVVSTRIQVQPRLDRNRDVSHTMYFDILMTARDDGAEIRASLALDYLNGFFSLAGD